MLIKTGFRWKIFKIFPAALGWWAILAKSDPNPKVGLHPVATPWAYTLDINAGLRPGPWSHTVGPNAGAARWVYTSPNTLVCGLFEFFNDLIFMR